jgi:hypothetical protein
MKAQRFALQQARKGHTLTQALEQMKLVPAWTVDESIVKDLYERVLGLKADAKPDGNNPHDIRIMLDAGAM